MRVRTLTLDDLPQVTEIQKAIIRQPVSQRWQDMVSRHVQGKDYVGFVAEFDGEVAGFVIGEIKVGNFGLELSGWLENVGVSPEFMGQGVGQALAARLFDHYRQHGVSEVFTAVRWDSGDLLTFFQQLGFERSPFLNLQRSEGAA